MEIRKIAVLGAGTMGNGIAQVSAEAGYSVAMMDIKPEFVQKGLDTISASLQRFVDKGRKTAADKAAIMARIATSTSLDAVKDADLVIEAIPEEMDLKKSTFKQVDDLAPRHAILASNTSSMPITEMAAVTRRPEQFVGIHFMNPAPIMKGVEVIKGRLTSESTMAASKAYVEKLGKTPVEAIDYAGFIVTRILDAMLNEAILCLMDGNKAEEIDKAMKVCTNFPMGPLELTDLAGADILLHGLECMHKEFGDRCRPAPLLKQMVRAGHVGRKAGRGFYSYK